MPRCDFPRTQKTFKYQKLICSPNFRSEQCLQSGSKSPVQRVVDHRRLQVVTHSLQQGIKHMVLFERQVRGGRRHAAVTAFKVHLVEHLLAFQEGVQGHALGRVRQDFQELFHFTQFFDICWGDDGKTAVVCCFFFLLYL